VKFNKSKIHKILVIKPSAIGDVVLSTPVIENLRNNFPDAEIYFLTQKYCADAVKENPFLNRVLTYDLNLDSGYCIIRNIRKQKYDMIIDLFGNPRTALITYLSRSRVRVGYKFRMRSYAYNIKVIPRGGEVHNIEFNLDSLRRLGLEVTIKQPHFYINSVHEEFADDFFNKSGLQDHSVIGINPGGTWQTKVWYPKKYIELIKKLKETYKILLFWGYEDERNEAAKIQKAAGEDVYLIPPADLKYMGALIKKCVLFLTNDTGPMHIACALGVNSAAIFGPTNSKLQGPFSSNSIVIKNEALSCLGCNLTRIEDCKFEHKCMKDLSVEYVYDKLMKFLDNMNIRN
jgi:heptosyltransferase-2